MIDNMITIGCLMAEVFEHDSGEIRSVSASEVRLSYCNTTESDESKIIVTAQMSELGNLGFLPIAIARIDPSDATQVFLRSVKGLSDGLRSALEHKGCELIRGAMSCLVDGQDGSTVSN
jgi:hypothetical protein